MEMATTELSSISETSLSTNGSMFEISDTREAMNRVLAEANMSLVRSQTTTSLNQQSKSGLRRLVSKLRSGVRTFQGKSNEIQ